MGSDVSCFNVSVVVEKQGHNGTVSTNRNCQRQTTAEGEWNPRPSAYQPSYGLTATLSWPPKLRDNLVFDYMCIALAVDCIGPTVAFSVLTRQAGSEHQPVCSAAL